MKVLVTGGTGFLGKNLMKHRPDWVYVSSKDCDLTKQEKVEELFVCHKPDAILHLAANVGGIKKNVESQADFYTNNTLIDVNVLSVANKVGINRVLSSLSTCAFPDQIKTYPFQEESLFDGEPAKTNHSYGMTKRMLQIGSNSYRDQYKRNYSTFTPSNIYGPHDHFGEESSHFVASLIDKVANSKDGEELEFWGTGTPLRQQMYVDDLCKIIPVLLEEHNTEVPIIVAPSENLSIREMIESLISKVDKKVMFRFNGLLDGQYRKDGSNKKLMSIIKDFEFTSFEKGVKSTYDWYLENK